MTWKAIDLTGQRFGRLVARDQIHNRSISRVSFFYREADVMAAVMSTTKLEKADGLAF